MKRLILIVLLAIPLISMDNMPIPTQSDDTHARLKALYVYQFATLVDWPKEFKQGDFVIGVFGESNLYDELTSKYSNKSVGSQSIKIKKYLNFAEISNSHILFVANENSERTAELVKKYKSKSTLIVTEKEGKLKDGAVINFIVKDNKQTYELSKTNAAKYKLIIGAKLENLAARVE
jgi:hypothetical protein